MAQKGTSPTQAFIPVKEVRNGVIILKDGGLRSVLLVSSINFSLKGPDEQLAVLGQFQNFLNGLDFSVQILIQSRRLDIRPYLALLEERFTAQTNDLMKIQVKEYIQFIKAFTDQNNIMEKRFFVVVPYSGNTISKAGASMFPFGGDQKPEAAAKAFEEERSQLEQRMAVVSQGLSGCGLRSVTLGTNEVVELLYKTFNPGELEKPIPVA